MRPITLSTGSLTLWAMTAAAAVAEPSCPLMAQQINDSNSLVLLGGTAKGPLKQVVVGEFGKDVDRQKRLLGEFDRCGGLVRADISYDKKEGNMVLRMVQNIARVKDGWQAIYDLSISVMKEGKPHEVNRKQGTINFMLNDQGVIASSTETFLLQGEKGFTATTHSFDARRRLIKSVSRGSDSKANGEYRYQWNDRDRLVASYSANSKITWSYDRQGREQRLLTRSHSAFSDVTTLDECQLWDDRGNCTLSYSRETEVFAKGIIKRNISAASRFEYWPKQRGD